MGIEEAQEDVNSKETESIDKWIFLTIRRDRSISCCCGLSETGYFFVVLRSPTWDPTHDTKGGKMWFVVRKCMEGGVEHDVYADVASLGNCPTVALLSSNCPQQPATKIPFNDSSKMVGNRQTEAVLVDEAWRDMGVR